MSHDETPRDLQHLAAIVWSSDDAIISKTLRGIVTSWNRGAERIFGYTSDEMIGRPITVLFPADRLPEEAEFLARLACGDHIEHFETVRLRKDGELINVSVTLSPLLDADGTICGISKIARDITEHSKLVARERAAREEAEAANRLKDDFLATVSHELRTPLNAMVGWLAMLKTGRLDAQMQRHALDIIGRNCQKQLDRINDLLDMSRIVTGRVVLDVAMLYVTDVVDDAVESLSPGAVDKGVTMRTDYEPAAPAVIGDAARLQQVVGNLLSNAIKFTARGGCIDVRVHQAGSKVLLTVADNGVGIDPAVLPHIFDRFRQGDSSSTRREGGLGLGLALVRHFVELHGGAVSAWSPGKGQGATFTVSLPVAAVRLGAGGADRRTASEPAEAFAEGRLKGLRVLVVEDDRDSRELICEVLREAGAVVFVGATVVDALGTLVAERPDAVVSDLGMPGEDGYALIKRIRALPNTDLARLPALALTAYTQSADRQVALAAGFNAYLAKPVSPSNLVESVFRLVTVGVQ